jgi:hypothetical protein
MKPEDHAWQSLRNHASAQLRGGFADRVLRAAQGPSAETWRALQAEGAAQLRPGFAERVLRAARILPGVPSLKDQFAFAFATAVLCIAATLFFHSRNTALEDQRNLASWKQIAMAAEDPDSGL